MTPDANRLQRHRLTLLPAGERVDAQAMLAALGEGGDDLLAHILDQDLGALWHYTLQSAGALESLPPATVEALRQARMSAISV